MSRRADILAECIDALFRDVDPASVLARYPAEAIDIAPLVDTARRLKQSQPDFESLGEAEQIRRMLRMPVLDDHAAESDRIAAGAIVLALTVAALFHLQPGALTALGLAAMVAWLIWWLNIAALHEAGESV